MSSKHWIERAIKKPGTFKALAQRAGESTDAGGKTGKRARLAETLMKMQKEKG
jgi:hypothetical protein